MRFSLSFVSLFGLTLFSSTHGHGHLTSPRARNWVAKQDGTTGNIEGVPPAEYCPNCLNLSHGVCGISDSHDYDAWLDSQGNSMPWSSQAIYTKGDVIQVKTKITAHHGGHMELKGCPLGRASTQECFDEHVLTFVRDASYDMPADLTYPERAYFYGWLTGDDASDFTFEFQLPEHLVGEQVLVSFRYVTANSCLPPGYSNYFNGGNSQGEIYGTEMWNPALNTCDTPFPRDGSRDGNFPEQFFNCAEVTITGEAIPLVPSPAPSSTSPVAMTSSPTKAPAPITSPPATCGGGTIGNGICENELCCSEWGYCGSSPSYCGGGEVGTTPRPSSTPSILQPTPTPPSEDNLVSGDDNRMIAYLGNWDACPTADQLAQYTHIIIAFAVSYTYNEVKNICNESCEIAAPPICNNAPNQGLVSELQASGKKVILSFGGAGMGGSWANDVNNCWDFCFGREEQIVDRLTDIVTTMNLDGVDLDYEYFYEDNQNGSGFAKGTEAQKFLKDVTIGLRARLPEGSIVTHAPMDPDLLPGKEYYNIIKEVAGSLDFLMPQYYNGHVRAVSDGFSGTGTGSISALDHMGTLVDLFDGDASKIVFGFCITDCVGSATASQAAVVMTELQSYFSCNGGAFFWAAVNDFRGTWSSVVNEAIQASTGCKKSSIPTWLSYTVVPSASPSTVGPTTLPTKHHDSLSNIPTSMNNPTFSTEAPFPPSNDGSCGLAWDNCINDVNSCCPDYECNVVDDNTFQCQPIPGVCLAEWVGCLEQEEDCCFGLVCTGNENWKSCKKP